MADMISGMIESFGGPVLEDLGKRVGLPADTVKMAVPVVTGLILMGVKRMASQPGGADKISQMVTANSERVGGRDLDTFVKEADPAKTADALNALTGGNSAENVVANLARKTGLDPKAVGQLMGVMAPAVLSQLGGLAKDKGLDAQGMVDLVNSNSDALNAIPGLDYIMDDVPGISDDIKRGLSKLFGG